MKNFQTAAVILGLSETGLGIVHSLAPLGIQTIGISHFREIGLFSKYVDFRQLPHPVNELEEFKASLSELSSTFNQKPVLFIAADEYLQFYIRQSEFIHEHFQVNISSAGIINEINDKARLYDLALKAEVAVPKTLLVTSLTDLEEAKEKVSYPVFVKAQNVTLWRIHVSGSTKGFVAEEETQLLQIVTDIVAKGVPVLLQEIIQSADHENVKYCVNIDSEGRTVQEFTLRKIHQYPIHFGIASSAESIHSEELIKLGRKLFSAIDYRGVGSAEFKLDSKSNQLKLVEINTRFWQQNFLSTRCGMNFALGHYLLSTGQVVEERNRFEKGIKWVNYHLCYQSFLQYKKQGELTFRQWRKDIKGPKTISLYNAKDKRPFIIHIQRTILRELVKILKPSKGK